MFGGRHGFGFGGAGLGVLMKNAEGWASHQWKYCRSVSPGVRSTRKSLNASVGC